jgi:hypothetical protein
MMLSTAGLTKLDGTHDPVNHGGDIAYDPERDRFWIIRSMHPFPTDSPSYIAPALQIASIPSSRVWSGGGTWEVAEELHAIEMGTDRVFDGGFLRNEWGQLNDPAVVQAIPSVALSRATTGAPVAEWTYRTHIVAIHLDIGPADFNRNGTTSGDDLTHWSDGYGLSHGASKSDGDADGDGDVDGRDFLAWQRNYSNSEAASFASQTTMQSRLLSEIDPHPVEDSQSFRAAWWLTAPQHVIRSSVFVLAQRMNEHDRNKLTDALDHSEDRCLVAGTHLLVSDKLRNDNIREGEPTPPDEHDQLFECLGRDISLFTRNLGGHLQA